MRKRSRDFKKRQRTLPADQAVSPDGSLVPRWLREYRFLAVILALALPLGIYEAFSADLPQSNSDVPAEWLLDSRRNLAQTLVELYPDRSQGYLLRAYQAGMCWDRGFQPEVCAAFSYHDLRDVRTALQEAIEHGGAADQEQLFHFYAFTLAQFDEPPEVLDEAVRLWRKHYPYSTKPDPRDLPKASK
jgi:hypothetical protein